MEKMFRQCVLTSKGSKLVTFLNDRPDLKEGVWVTLSDSEDPSRRWKVEVMTEQTSMKDFVSSHNSHIIHDKDMKRDSTRKKLS